MCRRLWPLRSDRQSVLKAAISHDKKIYSTIYNECNYLSMLWLKLNHVSNKDPRSKFNQCWSRVLCYWGVPSIPHGLALCMMTSSNGNIFRVAGTGEFPTQRPVTRSFDVYFDLRPNKQLSKNREADDLRRNRAHYDVILMSGDISFSPAPVSTSIPLQCL